MLQLLNRNRFTVAIALLLMLDFLCYCLYGNGLVFGNSLHIQIIVSTD